MHTAGNSHAVGDFAANAEQRDQNLRPGTNHMVAVQALAVVSVLPTAQVNLNVYRSDFRPGKPPYLRTGARQHRRPRAQRQRQVHGRHCKRLEAKPGHKKPQARTKKAVEDVGAASPGDGGATDTRVSLGHADTEGTQGDADDKLSVIHL